MTLKDLLKRKDKPQEDTYNDTLQPPEFRIIRSDTHSQEPIYPPTGPVESSPPRKHFGRLRRSSNASHTSASDASHIPESQKEERRLSHRLHLGRSSRSGSTSSINLPDNLPSIRDDQPDAQEKEAQWEKRATLLAQGTGRPSSPLGLHQRPRSPSLIAPEHDVNIQEAIRLHENGELPRSTEMFGKLADPNGANNALSQVLYGLALRHGWGCQPNPEEAVKYLSAAAANSASIEEQALQAGMKKGGAAKGELILAIFELANCFRHGWGVKKDPVAARHYYETAANLGDTDAMNEAAWCFLEGFGGKKDKAGLTQPYDGLLLRNIIGWRKRVGVRRWGILGELMAQTEITWI
ncbi:hypothetical protein FQN57_005480 [Myotisia sp. PD_48]|nr:hypothetical protein FQN57_005480 [Myotisia sp. PD_48]